MRKLMVLCLGIVALGFVGTDSALAKKKAEISQPPRQLLNLKAKEIKIDRNHDGVVDRVEIYDAKGVIIRVEADTNGDGKMDEWVFYKNGKATKGEKDTKKDGKPDTFLTYDVKGVIVKLEVDTDGDSKIDEWIFYKNGKPVRAEKDINKDGKADTWITY